ncbi:hypothetical protein VI03_21090 [Burkholderia vietnamiensis]|uniref:hypothetical protein n=1 Tax=Burkholderia vietnamiensis TaxID=60552 RepID=UPI000621F80E|nr:hypothetical protein [Burkholderia vietnamiensis]KKI36970.1 hypothetical protein VI03_21090 [Burkholderia vietnamiensis]KVF13237.1 hypothetical protein WJ05_12115 [Burkholderia vietnamiensis]
MSVARAGSDVYGDAHYFSLDEQIARARQAASRIDAGYYFTDDELDDERLTSAPHRSKDGNGNEWL